MKCPGCNFVCSDLRDICPKCWIDLRPHKETLKIPITNPKASLTELLEKLGVKRETESITGKPADSTQGSSTGILTRLFGSKKPRPEYVPRDNPSMTPEPTNIPAPSSSPPPPLAPVEAISFKTPPPSTPVPVNETPTTSIISSTSVFEIPAQAEDLNKILGELGGNTTLLTEPDEEIVPSEDYFEPEPTPAPVPYESEPLEKPEIPGITALFSEARNEIISIHSHEALELGVEQLSHAINPERVKILFELAREAILNPESESRFTEDIKISESRTVQAETLEQQLSQVEKFYEVPAFSLRGRQAETSTIATTSGRADSSEPNPLLPLLPLAPLRLHLGAALIDGALIVVGSLFTALLGVYFAHEGPLQPRLEQFRLGRLVFDIFDGITALNIFLCAVIVLSVLYPLVSLLWFKTTWGAHRMGLLVGRYQARAPRGYVLSSRHAVIRALSLPLSVLLLGFLPIFFKRRTLHDFIANTQVGLPAKT